MTRALKEEHVPAEWRRWVETEPSHRLRGTASIEIPVDVIAVQGLASTYEWTWTKDVGGGRSVMWLRDLLSIDLPNARIMSFEYDSKWLNDPAMVALEDCGERLLESIIWDRTHKGSREHREMCPIMARRPLILLGHSYGGLVIKQALVTAATAPRHHPRYSDYQSLITAVSGVMFLGTPHNGSSFASAGIFQANFRSRFGFATNTHILEPLALDTSMTDLKDLEKNFQEIHSSDRLSALGLFYFYETKPLTVGPFNTKLVVDKDSACYGSHKTVQIPLDANHMEMNKFGSRHESNYQRIVEKLKGMYGTARSIVQFRWGRYQYDTQHPGGVIKDIKHWLSPENAFNDAYLTRRAERLEGTCEWIYEVDVIANWLHSSPDSRTTSSGSNHSILIAGKAGSGKSVLAAYLHSILAERFQNENWSANDVSRCSGSTETVDCQHYTVTDNKAVLYFPVSMSTRPASMIRTLIDQLLYFQPTNSGLQTIVQSKLSEPNVRECTSEVGIEILIRLLGTFPSVQIIIDGLDECNNLGATIDFLEQVRQMKGVSLLLLSRQDQELDLTSNLYSLELTKLDIAHYNANDIDNFITEQLSCLAKANSYLREDLDSIRQYVSERALGMFQWVKLVLYELNFAQSRDDVSRFLHRFPRELNEAYSKTFKRLSQRKGFDKGDAILVLKLLLAAYRPLRWLDLAVAFQLHHELYKQPRIDIKRLEEIVDTATRKAHELPDSYFAFLGPLVDIRSTGETVDTIQWQRTTDRRTSRTMVICHHSLTQWIEGTASAVEMRSESWQEFHFSRRDAHKPLALLCLARVSSQSAIRTYLQDIYSPGCSSSPFSNYAGEYWSFHLRAVGGASTTNLQREAQYRDGVTKKLVLADFAGATLEHNIDFTTGVCLALSTVVKKIDLQKIKSLPKVIAVRNLRNALLPAARATGQLKGSLPDIFATLRELQNDMGLPSDEDYSGALFDTTTTTLGKNLDSETVLRVLATLQTRPFPTSPLQWQQHRRRETHIQTLCQASRALRQLSILLAVDPVRTWINSQTSDSGVSPLAALAHTSEAIDTYLAALLLPPELFSRYDFRDQFNAEHKHPQYGFVTAARRELSIQNDSSLDSTFYKENVMNHYRISAWDWATTRLLIASLEMSPEDPSGMDHAIKYWLASHTLWPKNSSDGNWEPAFEVMSRLPFQRIYKSAKRTNELLSTLLRGGAIFTFKYLVHLVPPLEHVFVSALMGWGLWRNSLGPTLQLLWGNRADFVLAFLVYVLRCRYSPWLFGTAPFVNWNSIWGPIFDIQGIIADPKGYTPPFIQPTWPWVTRLYYLTQESVIWFLSAFDVLACMPEMSSIDMRPEYLLRRTSFRLNRANGDTHGQWKKLQEAFNTHGFVILTTFRRLLFVERILSTLVVWIYDLIKAAAELLEASPWDGKRMLSYGVQLGLFAYARSAGVFNSIKLCLRLTFWYSLLDWYQPSSLLGLTYHYVGLPVKNICLQGLAHYYKNLMARLVSILGLIDTYEARIIQTVSSLEVHTAVLVLAGAICVTVVALWYIMSDPLSLESAARSCEKAEELARKATSIQEPIAFLKWRANGLETQDSVTFTRLLIDLDREE